MLKEAIIYFKAKGFKVKKPFAYCALLNIWLPSIFSNEVLFISPKGGAFSPEIAMLKFGKAQKKAEKYSQKENQ